MSDLQKGNSMFRTKLLKSALFLIIISLFLNACAGTATMPTSTPKPQATETVTIPSAPEPTETPFFKATEIAKFPIQCTDFELEHFALISPDENWLALPCGYLPDNQTLEIVSRNGQRKILQFKDYLPKGFLNGRVLVGSLRPQYWSDDGKFLYFAPRTGYSRNGICFYPDDGKALYRIKMVDGTVSTILPSNYSEKGYFFKNSPTGQQVVYLDNQNPVILDLKTGQDTLFTSSKDVNGNFVWSQDGLKLAYTSCQSASGQDRCSVSKSAILIYSTQENSSKIILEVERNLLHIEAWNGKILKILQRSEHCEESYLFFDTSTGQWLTPTPEP
jgi:hypothetical protein